MIEIEPSFDELMAEPEPFPPVCTEHEARPICDLHHRSLEKRLGRFGDFYGCPMYPACDRIADRSGHDGKWHLSDQATRRARIRAHAAFDLIWKRRCLSRNGCYRMLCGAMDLHPKNCHMKHFSIEQCRKVIETANEILTGFGVQP